MSVRTCERDAVVPFFSGNHSTRHTRGDALYEPHDVDLRAEVIRYRYCFEGRVRSAVEDVALLFAVVGDPPTTRGYSGMTMRRRLRAACRHLVISQRRVDRCYALERLGFTTTVS